MPSGALSTTGSLTPEQEALPYQSLRYFGGVPQQSRARGGQRQGSPSRGLTESPTIPPTPFPRSAPAGMGGLSAVNASGDGVSGGSGLFTPGGSADQPGAGIALSGPGALRQGIGTRILPHDSMALAALRRIY